MVKIGFEESKDQIFSNTLSYGLTNLIQSLIATFSFLIIIDHYDGPPVDVNNMDEDNFKGVFTELYGKYLLFDEKNPDKKQECLGQMSTLISGLPQIKIIPVYNALKAQLKSYAPEKPDDQTKQNKFYKLLAHIYVFYNDINCEYIKVVKKIPKKKIVAVAAEVAEVVVEEEEDDEDCSCFIDDDTEDATAATAATAAATDADMLQIVNSMSQILNDAVTRKEETTEQKAARNREIEAARNREIELLMNNNMDNNSSGIMEPITNVYDYITKQKYIENYIKKYNSHPKKDLKIHLLPRRFKVKGMLEDTVRFKKDHSQGIQFLYRNSYIFIYLYLKYILQDKEVNSDQLADYSDFIKGGSNEQSIEEQMIRLIS